MSDPLFVVSVAEVERKDVHVQFGIPPEWLNEQLRGTEAHCPGKTGEFEVRLSKNGREILVVGRARVEIEMPCARTLDPVPFTLTPDLHLLLGAREPSRAAESAAERPGAEKTRGERKGRDLQGKHRAGAGGKGRKAVPEAEESLSDADAARDTYEGDHVVLDGFLREHILLELPLFPLRSDLRSEDSPAIGPPLAGSTESRRVDPRLAPLAALADKMRQKKE